MARWRAVREASVSRVAAVRERSGRGRDAAPEPFTGTGGRGVPRGRDARVRGAVRVHARRLGRLQRRERPVYRAT